MTKGMAGHHRKRSGEKRGVSVMLLTVVLFVVAAVAIGVSFYEAEETKANTQALFELEEERRVCDDAIRKLMDGSDYLTAQMQQYAVTADRKYMDAYWREIYETRSRDKAVQVIFEAGATEEERAVANASKAESDGLMKGETWAMRLMAESEGMAESDMPEDVAACRLSAQDAALSAQEKRDKAVAYVFGPDYSLTKNEIRTQVNSFIGLIANRFSQEALQALDGAKRNLRFSEMLLVFVLLALVGTLVAYMMLVALPISRYARELAVNERDGVTLLSEQGATELKRFAQTLNALYVRVERDTERLRRLGYMDFLTDVPNRASITEYAAKCLRDEKGGVGVLIADVDNFKYYNDSYGHTVGDATLVKIARAICAAQPEAGGLAGRLCGEEFVVVVKNATVASLTETAERILQNVRGITAKDIDLPVDMAFGVTVSIGGAIWPGGGPTSFTKLLSDADQALYHSKITGKDKFTMNGNGEVDASGRRRQSDAGR